MNNDKLTKALRTKGPTLILLRATALLLGFATQIALTRWLPIEDYGLYTYLISIIGICAIVTKLGHDRTVSRYVGEYTTLKQWPHLKGLLQVVPAQQLSASIIVASLFVTYAHYSSWTTNNKVAIYWSAVLIPLIALFQTRNSLLRSFKRPILAELPESILRPILMISAIVATQYVFNIKGTYTLSLYVIIGCTILSMIAGKILLDRATPTEAKQIKPTYDTKLWLYAGLPFIAVQAMRLLITSIDKIMLGNLYSIESVGIYSVASQVANLGTFGLYTVNAIALPYLSRLHTQQDRTQLQNALDTSGKIVFGLTGIVVACLIFTHTTILDLFGAQFRNGATTLFILLGGVVATAMTGMTSCLINFSGKGIIIAKILALDIVINIFLNWLLIPKYGLEGAACATFFSTVFLQFSLLYYVQKSLGYNPSVIKLSLKRQRYK